jgi:hypothetical protein
LLIRRFTPNLLFTFLIFFNLRNFLFRTIFRYIYERTRFSSRYLRGLITKINYFDKKSFSITLNILSSIEFISSISDKSEMERKFIVNFITENYAEYNIAVTDINYSRALIKKKDNSWICVIVHTKNRIKKSFQRNITNSKYKRTVKTISRRKIKERNYKFINHRQLNEI